VKVILTRWLPSNWRTIMPVADLSFLTKKIELAELHVHVGSSGSPALMWDIAHQSGLKLPVGDFWEFEEMVTVKKPLTGDNPVIKFNEYLKIFNLTELIQSSPLAMERIIYDAIGGAYRNNNITTLELRFCPMLRNREGEQDLDHIIMASLAGLDRALLAYPQVRAGLIFEMDRRFSLEKNQIILQKALKYKNRGVVGIDIAGPRLDDFDYSAYAEIYQEAASNGLGTTIHTGEEGSSEEMGRVIKEIQPLRVGHGVKAAWDKNLMHKLQEQNIILEICPTSNLRVGVIQDLKELSFVLKTFLSEGVKFTVNTDGPEFFQTNIRQEFRLLLENNILSRDEILKVNQIAHEASFINNSDFARFNPLNGKKASRFS